MVAPFAGGPPPGGQGSWDGQSRYDSQPHSYSQEPRGAMSSSRQVYNTPPPDASGSQHPHNHSEHDRPRQNPQALERQQREQELAPPPGAERHRAQGSTGGSRRPSGSRICGKCGEPLAGQFVRALDNTFHLDCFTCNVSSVVLSVLPC